MTRVYMPAQNDKAAFKFAVITDTHIRSPLGDQSSPYAVNEKANGRARFARVGFEPTNELPRCWFSRPVLSTAQPPLHNQHALITINTTK